MHFEQIFNPAWFHVIIPHLKNTHLLSYADFPEVDIFFYKKVIYIKPTDFIRSYQYLLRSL